ncbi:MAG TPA: F0F1 ATP synthase subunit B' [Alphaproteobacteria bacterium]|jgi:F-type H+-transporting ATPase subunit b|nr:F0F1 ATP synthase subunit B' [Alphaproteobacteria bacterium]HAM46554.1 F0F1 ATP synthase subunit B' [Alphaproteobacteria bacterium]HBA41975.1 F0F1 ATP synthase subunit B' [Alphaproteobacteria bacterium]HBC53394.1 F0F1 ATP synthase subunit B' [Alphaproteobacteria bacterium]HBF99776.1 F0F1 ATP synthase subunit B' [Alphaproteobacteria bacterium]
MPQLVIEDFAPQIVWLVITFGLLYLMLARGALPRIATVLEQRRDKIADDLDDAARFKQEAEDALKDYEAALADARAKAHEIAAQTRATLTADVERHTESLQQTLDARMAEAEERIAATKAEAMKSVRSVASDAAGAIIGKLLSDTADTDAVATAVDAELRAG